MTWSPLHPDHSIDRVRLVFRFSQNLPDKTIMKLGKQIEEIQSDLGLTTKNYRDSNTIVIGPTGPEDQYGWHILRGDSPSGPLEVMALHRHALVYETGDYTRWKYFIERLEKVVHSTLKPCLEIVDLNHLILEYIDRFVYDGEADEASPTSLIRDIDHWLPDEALAGQRLWHLHRGWFETYDGVNLLINQNFDCQEGDVPERGRTKSVQIYTKVEFRDKLSEVDFDGIGTRLNSMHKRSNEVFGSMLLDGILDKIGLAGDK